MTSKRKAEQPPVKEEDAKADVAGTGAHGSAVVFPGDVLSLRGSVVRLGSGLLQSGSNVVASRAGRIQHGANARLSVDNVQKRYLPAAEDLVIGLVCEKHSESYKVDIGGPELATLPALAFEGATKRNKPNIPLHSLIYCRVLRTHRDLEAELTCMSPHIKTDWVAGQSFFGPLEGGLVVSVSLATARRLLGGEGGGGGGEGRGGGGGGGAGVLEMCGEWVGYEVAVGLNGRVWVQCEQAYATVLLTNAIVNSQHMTHAETHSMVKQLFSTSQG